MTDTTTTTETLPTGIDTYQAADGSTRYRARLRVAGKPLGRRFGTLAEAIDWQRAHRDGEALARAAVRDTRRTYRAWQAAPADRPLVAYELPPGIDTYETADGVTRYRARVHVGGERLGRRFGTLAEAVHWQHVQRTRGPREATVREAYDHFLDGMRSGAIRNRSGRVYDEGAIRKYEQALRLYTEPRFGAWPLARLDRGALQGMVDELLREGRSAAVARNAVKPLQAMFKRLVQDGQVAVSPAHGLRLPAPVSRQQRYQDPSDEAAFVDVREARVLLEALPVSWERAAYALAFYAGLRIGEIRALRWEQVDLADAEIRISEQLTERGQRKLPKSHRVRVVPVIDLLRRELEAWRLAAPRSDEGYVASRIGSQPLTESNLRERAAEVWVRAGLRYVTPHEGRHTYVSLLAAAGVAADDARLFSGHSSEEVRQIYVHVTRGALARAKQRVDAHLGSE